MTQPDRPTKRKAVATVPPMLADPDYRHRVLAGGQDNEEDNEE